MTYGEKSGSLYLNSSTWPFQPLDLTTQHFDPSPDVDRVWISFDMKNWTNFGMIDPCNDFWTWIFTRFCVFSACSCLAFKTITNIVKIFEVHSNGHSPHESRWFTSFRELDLAWQFFKSFNINTQAVSRCFIGVCTKDSTSFGSDLISSMLKCDWPSTSWVNSSHQFATAPIILSGFAEWIVRNKSSACEDSAVKLIVHSPHCFQASSIQRTDSSECRMSTFFENFHHDICNRIVLSSRFADVRSVSFFLVRGMTNVHAETFLRKA